MASDAPVARADQNDPTAQAGDALTELARRARDRDPGALRQLVESLAPSVRRTCRGVLGHGHPDLEDAIQESLVAIVRALPDYRFEGSVVHYATKVCLRLAISIRRRGREREAQLRAAEARVPDGACPDPRDSRFDQWLVRMAIRELPEPQAEAIILRMVFGYTLEEIAAATGVPLNTTKSRLRVGKDHLRDRLGAVIPEGKSDDI